jgi:hypothetical protein
MRDRFRNTVANARSCQLVWPGFERHWFYRAGSSRQSRAITLLAYIEIKLSSRLEGVPGADMTNQLSWNTIGEWLAGFAPEGPLRSAVLLIYGLCVAIAPFIYKYYLGVLA